MDLTNTAAFTPFMDQTVTITATRIGPNGVAKVQTVLPAVGANPIKVSVIQGGNPGNTNANGERTAGAIFNVMMLLSDWTLTGYPQPGDVISGATQGTLIVESSQPNGSLLFIQCVAQQWLTK